MDEYEAYFSRILASYEANEIKEDPRPRQHPCRCDRTLQTRIFTLILMWESQQVLKDSIIVTTLKKGEGKSCRNYRGISLLSTTGKVFAKILLNRLQIIAKKILPESQCIPCISWNKQDYSQEKSREQQKTLYLVFFDSVPRAALWKVLHRLRCPNHFISLVKTMHDNMYGVYSTKTRCQKNF